MTVEPTYFVCRFDGCLLEVVGKISTRHKSNRIGGDKIDSWETIIDCSFIYNNSILLLWTKYIGVRNETGSK